MAAERGARRRIWRSFAAGVLVATALPLATVSSPAVAAPTPPGTITTVAGGPGFGPATTVAMMGVALAVHDGHLYIADVLRNVVRVVDPATGAHHPLAGQGVEGGNQPVARFGGDGGPALAANLFRPSGVAVAADGTVYVSDTGNARIRRIDLSGTITTVAGTGVEGGGGDGGPALAAQLYRPTELGVGPDGSVFVLEPEAHRVRRIRPDGVVTTAVDGDQSPDDLIGAPSRMAVDPAGRIFLLDWNRVLRVDVGGAVSVVVGGGAQTADGAAALATAIVNPGPIAVDGAGNLLFGDGDRLRRVGPTGTVTTIAGGGGPGLAPDGSPAVGAANGGIGTLAADGSAAYFTDGRWVHIRQVAGGIIRTVAASGSLVYSGSGGPALGAVLTNPLSVATDAAGNAYVVLVAPQAAFYLDPLVGEPNGPLGRTQSVVVKVTPGGTITTVAGNGQLPPVNFDYRSRNGKQGTAVPILAQGAIAIDRAGNVYFAEQSTFPTPGATKTVFDIARVDPAGVFTMVAGGGPSEADGVPATDAALHGVPGLVIDVMGNLVLVDSGPAVNEGTQYPGAQVRRVGPDGIIRTIAGAQPGFGGDGGRARAAQVNVPWGLAYDRAGNLYLADAANHRVRRIDTRGRITTVAGSGRTDFSGDGGPALDAGLAVPLGVAVDTAGNLFIADEYRIRRVDRSGVITTVAGTGALGFSGDGGLAPQAELSLLGGIALDPAGNLFLAEWGSGRVRRVAGVGQPGPLTEADAWGWNVLGQLGDGSGADRPRPGPVAVAGSAAAELVHVGNGLYHGLGVRADGTVVAWGANFSGQLGDGTVTTRLSPVVVAGVSGVVGVAGGFGHSLALRADGTVWAWGSNSLGELGDGTTVSRSRAAPVPGLTGVIAVSAGLFHNLALKADGTVWAWGWNGYGALGDGSTVTRLVPVPVSGLTDVVSVAAGGLHSLAVLTDGTGRAWGLNHVGQLGDGSTVVERDVPVRVVGLTSASEVTAGLYHSLARRVDGSVRAWGWNYFGQLGDGTTVDRRVPVAVGGLAPVTAVVAAALHSVAVTRTGSASAWGFNNVGQLGDGTTTDRHAPVAVVSLAGATEPAAGPAYHSLVLRTSG